MNHRHKTASVLALCLSCLPSLASLPGAEPRRPADGAAPGDASDRRVAEPAREMPEDVPPILGMAIAVPAPRPGAGGDADGGTVRIEVPRVAWKLVGRRLPKKEWPKLEVTVEEEVLEVEVGYLPATQLREAAQNRILDMKGRRLDRGEVRRRLASRTPVLVSVSGRMPDPYYLQCTKADTLIVALGAWDSPAPELLPRPQDAGLASLKGWELYVWEDGGIPHFSLLVGTNRFKSREEIANAAVRGLDAVRSKLEKLQAGQTVSVLGRSLLEAPPAAARKAVVEHCEKIGLTAY